MALQPLPFYHSLAVYTFLLSPFSSQQQISALGIIRFEIQ